MPFIEWQNYFALGVDNFDEHHKHLIDLINKIHDEITGGVTVNNIDKYIIELSDYATYHFASEERWMSMNGYPDLEQHRKEHIAFSNKIVEYREAFNNGESNVSFNLIQFLLTWLTKHILDSDADYGRFARNIVKTDHWR